jgi:hypothetical protein
LSICYRKAHFASGEADARRIVRHCLQRRATAPKRIGVGYQLRELADPGQWFATAEPARNAPACCMAGTGQAGDVPESTP